MEKSVTELLAERCQREYAGITGSATIAIVMGLKELGLTSDRIAIPNNVCFSIPQAVLYSGNIPVYIDVDEDDFGISPERLEELENIAAVIAVHSYGRCCKIEKISDFCERRGIPLVEDVSVALGAKYNGRSAGSFGDFSVLSFGAGKIIDIGHGGALLTNDKNFYKSLLGKTSAIACYTSQRQKVHEEISSFHTSLYNNEYLENGSVDGKKFRRKLELNRASYLYSAHPQQSERLLPLFKMLDANISRRRDFALKIQENLESMMSLKVIKHAATDVYWRQNILLDNKDIRNTILKALLAEKIKVSSWYPPVNLFFEDNAEPNADSVSKNIGDKILNLWVNDEVEESYLSDVSSRISEML